MNPDDLAKIVAAIEEGKLWTATIAALAGGFVAFFGTALTTWQSSRELRSAEERWRESSRMQAKHDAIAQYVRAAIGEAAISGVYFEQVRQDCETPGATAATSKSFEALMNTACRMTSAVGTAAIYLDGSMRERLLRHHRSLSEFAGGLLNEHPDFDKLEELFMAGRDYSLSVEELSELLQPSPSSGLAS